MLRPKSTTPLWNPMTAEKSGKRPGKGFLHKFTAHILKEGGMFYGSQSPGLPCPAAQPGRRGRTRYGLFGKPLETMGRKATGLRRLKAAMFAGPHLANHWKQWDAKPRSCGAPNAGPKVPGSLERYARRAANANHRKRWDAKLNIRGLNRRSPLKHEEGASPLGGRSTTAACQPGCRILCIRVFCKERKRNT